MVNETQRPTLTEADLPEPEYPRGMFPAPLVDDSFNPYENKGDLWLYQESFMDGLPDTTNLMGILQKEKMQRLRLAMQERDDHAAMIEQVSASITRRSKRPDKP